MIAILTEKVSGELEMLQRHLVILKQVVENEPIGILKLAEETKIPSHKVRYSLAGFGAGGIDQSLSTRSCDH